MKNKSGKVVEVLDYVVNKAVSDLQQVVSEEVGSSHPYGSHRFNIDMYVSDGMLFKGRPTFSKVDLQEALRTGEVKMTGELRKMVGVVSHIYDLSQVWSDAQEWWSPEVKEYWINSQLKFWKEKDKEDVQELDRKIKSTGLKTVTLGG